jgi:hypothetical protein
VGVELTDEPQMESRALVNSPDVAATVAVPVDLVVVGVHGGAGASLGDKL